VSPWEAYDEAAAVLGPQTALVILGERVILGTWQPWNKRALLEDSRFGVAFVRKPRSGREGGYLRIEYEAATVEDMMTLFRIANGG
jgi:hypothetical protein